MPVLIKGHLIVRDAKLVLDHIDDDHERRVLLLVGFVNQLEECKGFGA